MTSSKRTQQLKTVWLQNQSDKDAFTKHVFNQNKLPVLRRLVEILNERLKTIEVQETNQDQYNVPNWQALQAHRNGQRQELLTLLDLLNFVDMT